MTHAIRNEDLYLAEKTRPVFEMWHRRVFGPSAKCWDVDLIGYCDNEARHFLWVAESSTLQAGEKATTLLRDLADHHDVPAVLVQVDLAADAPQRAWILRKDGETELYLPDEESLKDWLGQARLAHHHGERPLSEG